MSQITRALKKVQEMRDNEKNQKPVAAPEKVDMPAENTPVVETPAIETPVIQTRIVETPVDEKPAVDQAPAKPSVWMILGLALSAVALLVSIITFVMGMANQSQQDKVLGLQHTINLQNKRINQLIVLYNENRSSTKNQISELSTNLQSRLDEVASTSKDNYDNMKDAILDDKQETEFLDGYTKKLNQRIEELTAMVNQVNAPKTPSSTNNGN